MKDEIDCTWSGSMVIWTHCFTSDANLAKQLQGKSQEEQVKSCMGRQ